MPYDPEKHHRCSIRLKGYDSAQPGAHLVTICAQAHTCLFGAVADGEMHRNDAGRMVHRWWNELNRKSPNVRTDAFVVIPNHIHGIIIGTNNKPTVGADLRVRPDDKQGTHIGVPLPEIVQRFKTMTTNGYDHVRKPLGEEQNMCSQKMFPPYSEMHQAQNDSDALKRVTFSQQRSNRKKRCGRRTSLLHSSHTGL